MADHSAIAAVSRTLRTLLQNRMVTGAQVTIAPPDVNVGVDGPRVNLYLYEVVENAGLKNQEIPGAGHPGTYGRPPLSLNLRYLLTSYSGMEAHTEADINAQSLLGDAMRVLHDFGFRIGNQDEAALDEVLTDEFERLKITLRPADLEEAAKIWSALPSAAFRRSVAYEVTVVQIETLLPRPRPKPVEIRRILATVRRRPQILAAYVTPLLPADSIGETRAGIGEEITIIAEHAAARRLYVRLGGLDPIQVSPGASGEIRIEIPDADYPEDLDNPAATRPIPPEKQLQPGALEIRLVAEHPVDGVKGGQGKGEAILEERRYDSNAMLLQLVPTVTQVVLVNGQSSATLNVQGKRLWHAGARAAEVIIGDLGVAILKDRAPLPTSISVHVPLSEAAAALPTGVPLPVAVQVDGARSRDGGVTFTMDP